MDVLGIAVAVFVLVAMILQIVRSDKRLRERLEAFYERLKYTILSLFVKE